MRFGHIFAFVYVNFQAILAVKEDKLTSLVLSLEGFILFQKIEGIFIGFADGSFIGDQVICWQVFIKFDPINSLTGGIIYSVLPVKLILLKKIIGHKHFILRWFFPAFVSKAFPNELGKLLSVCNYLNFRIKFDHYWIFNGAQREETIFLNCAEVISWFNVLEIFNTFAFIEKISKEGIHVSENILGFKLFW